MGVVADDSHGPSREEAAEESIGYDGREWVWASHRQEEGSPLSAIFAWVTVTSISSPIVTSCALVAFPGPPVSSPRTKRRKPLPWRRKLNPPCPWNLTSPLAGLHGYLRWDLGCFYYDSWFPRGPGIVHKTRSFFILSLTFPVHV